MKIINDARKNIGKRLFNIAMQWSSNPKSRTKKSMREEIKACKGRVQTINGSKSIVAALEATLEVAELIHEARRNKRKRKYASRSTIFSKESKAKYGVWRRGPVEYRLKEYKKTKYAGLFADTLERFEENYNWDVAPQVKVVVGVNSESAAGAYESKLLRGEMSFQQSEGLDWDYYSKNCRYPKKLVTNIFSFSKHYIENIISKNLDILDGMLTLSAIQLECKGACELYEARWLRQRRGYQITEEEGFIAVKDDFSFHAETAQSAVKGLARKINNTELVGAFKNGMDSAAVARLIQKHGDTTVTKKDAIKAGACVSGTKNWCAKVGIDYDGRSSCTVAEIYEAWKLRPRPEIKLILTQSFLRNAITVR